MRGIKLTPLEIDSLVSGNLRINGKIYTPSQAYVSFPNQNKQIQDAVSRAWNYHMMAKSDCRQIISPEVQAVNELLNNMFR